MDATAMVAGAKKISATGGSDDTVNQLERLAKLKQQGVLTEEEFRTQKVKIMNQ
jgi:hypothetical protein